MVMSIAIVFDGLVRTSRALAFNMPEIGYLSLVAHRLAEHVRQRDPWGGETRP